MTDEQELDVESELDAGTDVDAGSDEEAEVEGFGSINTTRDNIPRRPRPAVAPAPGIGGIGAGTASGIAIKEQGVR